MESDSNICDFELMQTDDAWGQLIEFLGDQKDLADQISPQLLEEMKTWSPKSLTQKIKLVKSQLKMKDDQQIVENPEEDKGSN